METSTVFLILASLAAVAAAIIIWKLSQRLYKKFQFIVLGIFIVCILGRLLTAIVNKPSGGDIAWLGNIQDWEWWLFGTLLAAITWWALLAWQRKCPQCQSFVFKEISRELTDKSSDTEQMVSKLFSGPREWDVYKEREVVTSTYSVAFKCLSCDHTWEDEIEKKKHGSWRTTNKILVRER